MKGKVSSTILYIAQLDLNWKLVLVPWCCIAYKRYTVPINKQTPPLKMSSNIESDVWSVFVHHKDEDGYYKYVWVWVHFYLPKMLMSICAIFRWYWPYEKNKNGKNCTAKYREDLLLSRKAPASTLSHHLNRNHPEWKEDLEKQQKNRVKKRQGTLYGTQTCRRSSESGGLRTVLKDFIESNDFKRSGRLLVGTGFLHRFW